MSASDGQGNPFFEHWALGPATERLGHSKNVDVALIGEEEAPCGLVPLTTSIGVPSLLGSVASVWTHVHCFDTSPLVRGDLQHCISALFGRLARNHVRLLRWPMLPMDTEFAAALLAYLDRNRLSYSATKTIARPMLNADLPCCEAFL